MVGVGRSGSSALAGALAHSGIDMGDTRGYDSPEYNARGFHEDTSLVHLNTHVIGDYHHPVLDWKARLAQAYPQFVGWASIRTDLATTPNWGAKDPRMIWTLPAVINACRDVKVDPYVIFTRRMAEHHHRSFTRFTIHTGDRFEVTEEELSQTEGMFHRLIERQREMERFVEASGIPFSLVRYEGLVVSPRHALRHLFTDIFGRPTAANPLDIERGAKFIDPKLRHY